MFTHSQAQLINQQSHGLRKDHERKERKQAMQARLAQADLIKDNGHHYFIKFLEAPDAGTTAETRAQAAFVLATICHGCGPGRSNFRAHQVNMILYLYHYIIVSVEGRCQSD